MLKNLKKAAAIVLSFAMAVQFGLADSYYVVDYQINCYKNI